MYVFTQAGCNTRLIFKQSKTGLNSKCSILPLDLDKQQRRRIYKNIILYFYFSTVTLVWCSRAIVESLRTQKSYQELKQPAGTDFSQISRPYIILKLPRNPYSHASSSTQCLFFIGHDLNACNACSPLVTAYTYALLVFHWSWFAHTRC